MPAREITCTVTEKTWITNTVVHIRFEPSKAFRFEPGQFLSVVVPSEDKRPPRRAYSFAFPYDLAKKNGYELLIKVLEDGTGSRYMARLEKGDTFKAFAPYGDFLYHPPKD
ncbi:MAG TPA: FAD-binding oxidoreductase, partial [Bdellovibrionota bacterium]|nr:FAD-binding oxidoreductase [Bdellovibrionota bacterium]